MTYQSFDLPVIQTNELLTAKKGQTAAKTQEIYGLEFQNKSRS